MHILEEMIESKLKEKYTEEDVERFYSTFKDNLRSYREENSLAVETLFDVIDFDKFK